MKTFISLSLLTSTATLASLMAKPTEINPHYQFYLDRPATFSEANTRLLQTKLVDSSSDQFAKITPIADWTWPGDGSPQSLAKHLEEFHGEDTSQMDMQQMLETHNSIHDRIGPVSFDSHGNASGPSIGIVAAPPPSKNYDPSRRFTNRTNGGGSNGYPSASYRRFPVSQSAFGSTWKFVRIEKRNGLENPATISTSRVRLARLINAYQTTSAAKPRDSLAASVSWRLKITPNPSREAATPDASHLQQPAIKHEGVQHDGTH